ncbi:MAG: PAS domain S-box protein [Williamsia herbipolensis]|nr:PAS domain S-box protein [Williamsia herbipolensis]
MGCEHAHEASVLRRVVDTVPALIGYWDTALRNVAANHAYLEFFGLTPDQVRGMHIRDVLGRDVFERNRPYIEGVLAGARQQFDRTLVDAHGRTRHTQATYVPDEVDGRVVGFFVLVADVSRRVEAEHERDDAIRLLEASMHHAPVGHVVMDACGRVMHANAAACALLGYTRPDLEGMRWVDIAHPEDDGRDALHDGLLDGSCQSARSEQRLIRRDGTEVWVQRVSVLVRDEAGIADDMVIAQIHDISDRKDTQVELARRAVTDALTGLGNRHALRDDADGPTVATGVLYLDIDDFKTVNDAYGHVVGDELLVAVADRIRGALRPGDVAYRVGGDEFVVLTRSVVSSEQMDRYLSLMRVRVTGTYELSSLSYPLPVAVSVGAGWSDCGDQPSLIAAADAAMYEHKRSVATATGDVPTAVHPSRGHLISVMSSPR